MNLNEGNAIAPHWLRGELVDFFRKATEGDYFEALKAAEQSIANNLLNPPRMMCKNGMTGWEEPEPEREYREDLDDITSEDVENT